jgi:hypothetical protein
MGHKAVAIIDFDNLQHMEDDPAEFVRRFKNALLTYQRLGGSVSIGGATVVNVVWSGHTDREPVLRIVDFRAEDLTRDAEMLQALGLRLDPDVERYETPRVE